MFGQLLLFVGAKARVNGNLAWFVFEKPLSVTQIFGLCVCITGGISYAIQIKRDKTKSAKAMQTQEMTKPENPTNDKPGAKSGSGV